MSSKSPGMKRRQLIVRVLFLDDTVVPFQIEAKATGFVLTNLVYQYLKLVESDYFGLEFIDPKGKKCWLDHDKAVSKQVPNNSMLIFCVKFYTPDPGQLEEEYTRYLFALQIKRDLGQGVLICTDATACLLASYILQAELGDYLDSYHSTPNYFADKKFFPHQTDEHDLKILDYHKNHIGQSPAEADLNLLDIARKTELYGVIMHPAKDHEGVQLNLAVASLGILVFQNFTKINTFSWAKIRKLSFKRKKFLIKLHPENYGFYKDTVEFYFDNRDDSKNFWKKCIENHSFFRCVRTERAPRPKSKWIVTRGSSFRYYGRTQKELIETAREQQIGKHRPFDRSYHSMRSISQFASNTEGNGQNGGGMTSAMSMNLVNGSNGNSQSTGNGTQSLNRNLASRSTGAIQMSNGLQSNNNNSTLSSNDDSSVNLQQHPGQNPAHHLSYVANSQQQQASPSIHPHHHHYNNGNKSATLQSAQSYGGRMSGPMYHHHDDSGDYHDDPEHQMHNGADEYDNEEEEEEEEDDEEVDDPLSHQDPHHLAYKQRFSPQEPKGSRRYRQAMDDTSTHGSRTIDSRYSVNNKGLGLSDEDDAENERDEDEDEEEEDDEEGEPYDYDEEQHEQQMASPPLVNDESSYGQQHSRYGHEQKDYGQMSNGHQVVQDNGNNSTMHRCTCGQLHPVVEQHQVTSLNRTASNQIRNRPAASSNNYQNQESNQIDQYNQQISDSDGGISSSYSFRNPTRPKSGNLISLPIQQQQQPSVQHQSNLRPSTLKKIDINTTTTSDSHSLVPINPNKIISRKEVITTYKEETKNTLLEECYQTTTFYDSTTPSTTQQQQILSQQPAAPPPPKSLLTTKEDNIDNKYGHLQASHQQQPSEDIDNDDATKNDRCSLAAKILYSNLYRQPNINPSPPSSMPAAPTQTGIYGMNNRPGFERIKRPSTLVKPFATSMTSTTTTTSNSTFTNGADSAEIGKHGVFTTLGSKPNYASINKILTNSRSNYNTNNVESVGNDDQFPPPPPSNQLAGDELNDIKYIQISKTPPSFFYIEDEFKRKKFPFEESYCIVKELVMTERTYKKDLEVLTSDFRQFTSNISLGNELPLLESLLYSQALQPIYQFHTQFLKDLEIRLFHWTEKINPASASDEASNKVGDLLNNLNLVLKHYKQFIEKQEDLLVEIDSACKRSKRVDNVFREFEAQKVCYLPFILFLAKPIQRLIHYKLLFERLLICYGPKHRDYHETYNVYAKLEELSGLVDERLPFIENKQKLMELQRDLQGADAIFTNLAKNNRQFVREGSLQKLSRKGYQQRMFFLFNDVLLYCARSSNPVLQFKVHGEYHLRHLQIEDGNPHVNIPNSFTIYTSNRSLLLSTVSQDEKNRWIQDLYECIERCKSSSDDKAPFYPSLKSNSSSDNNLDTAGTTSHDEHNDQATDYSTDQQNSVLSAASNGLDKKPASSSQHRANTTIHVCWHRNTSVSMVDIHKSVINHLSGYLLRKFKNSNGWQKLWVVFTNFCLFFYKTYQDEFPLASLPLLGYSITVPTEADNINKDYVFKLQFKNHVYFFRAESQYSFDRWLEVIESAAEKQGGV